MAVIQERSPESKTRIEKNARLKFADDPQPFARLFSGQVNQKLFASYDHGIKGLLHFTKRWHHEEGTLFRNTEVKMKKVKGCLHMGLPVVQ